MILKKVTNIVKVTPFVSVFFCLLTISGYFYMPEKVIRIMDMLVYSSPFHIGVLLLLSRRLMLCKWHRLQCVLPVVAAIPSVIDRTLYRLSPLAADINIIIMMVLFATSLVNAYFVFVKPAMR